MTDQPQTPLPAASDRTPASRRRRQVTAVSLVGAGVVTGGILAGTLSAGASTSGSAKAAPAASWSTSPSTAEPMPDGPHGGMGRLAQTGTVTAVGASSVTVRTATATTTFQVTSASTVVKNGAAGLAGVKVGDTVRFGTTTTGGTTIAVLVDGKVPAGGFGRFGGPGGPGRFGPGRLDRTGTATAVGATSVTVKSGTATTTYQVTSASRVFANGSTKVSAVRVGDTLRFRTTTTGGTTIAVLVDGQPPADGPHGHGAGPGRGWGPPA